MECTEQACRSRRTCCLRFCYPLGKKGKCLPTSSYFGPSWTTFSWVSKVIRQWLLWILLFEISWEVLRPSLERRSIWFHRIFYNRAAQRRRHKRTHVRRSLSLGNCNIHVSHKMIWLINMKHFRKLNKLVLIEQPYLYEIHSRNYKCVWAISTAHGNTIQLTRSSPCVFFHAFRVSACPLRIFLSIPNLQAALSQRSLFSRRFKNCKLLSKL